MFSSDWGFTGAVKTPPSLRDSARASSSLPRPAVLLSEDGKAAVDPFRVVQHEVAWALQAYLRFAELPYVVENGKLPLLLSSEQLPLLLDGDFLVPAAAVLEHVADKHRDLSAHLAAEEKANSAAFTSVVTEQLAPLREVIRWAGDDGILRDTVLPPMRRTLPLGLRNIVPFLGRRYAARTAHQRGILGLPMKQLLARASALYGVLDARLGSECDYFHGEAPSTIDAVVWGHVAEALTDVELVLLLPRHRNLMRHFRLVADRYFAVGRYTVEGRSKEVLEAYFARADYENAQNAFCQLEGTLLCSDRSLIKEPFPEAAPELPASATPAAKPPPGGDGAAADNSDDGNEGDEARKDRGNTAWLTMAVTTVVTYLLLRYVGGSLLETEDLEIDRGDREEEEG